MFKNAFRLPFKLLGIPLYLDVTFLIILPLFAWLIASQIEAFIVAAGLPIAAEPLITGATPYWLGLASAIGLFISVVIHELGHAVTGRAYGVETERITLWLLGGMAQFKEMPRQRGGEAVVAIAGPITSFALAIVGWALLQVIPTELSALYFVLSYVTFMNVALAVFNLIPALPLDGGRVLRSLLALRMDQLRATQVSAGISRFLAVTLGLLGLLAFNLFLILIAFFIYMAVTAESRYAAFTTALEDIGVADLMTRQVMTVSAQTNVSELIDRMFREARLGYPVTDEAHRVVGFIELEHVQGAPKTATVAAHMTREVPRIAVMASAQEAFELMSKHDFGRLIVVDPGGDMVGILTKTDLIRALQVRLVGMQPARA
jgi:Zn-dependent protease/CBS domain-containing protein